VEVLPGSIVLLPVVIFSFVFKLRALVGEIAFQNKAKKAAKAFATGYRHTFARTWGLKGLGAGRGVAAANSC
jgi:hypothetical protein